MGCPGSQDKLFPAHNAAGPIAEALREKLSGFPWARPGLGLPVAPELEITNQSQSDTFPSNNTPASPLPSPETYSPVPIPIARKESETTTTKRYKSKDSDTNENVVNNGFYQNKEETKVDMKNSLTKNISMQSLQKDFMAFKQKGNTWKSRIHRYIRRHYAHQKYSEPIMGRNAAISMCLVIGFILMIISITTSVQSARKNNHDPMLDPLYNPNIHNADIHLRLNN